jgi:hypothetical protein
MKPIIVRKERKTQGLPESLSLQDQEAFSKRGVQSTLKRVAVVLLGVMLLLTPIQNAKAAGQVTSGEVQLSNTLSVGDTAYSVDYSYPSTAQVGTNLTLVLTLHVDSLTGLVEYVANYGLVVDVFLGQNELNGSLYSINGAPFLYPGSTWGPNNVTIPLTQGDTGLAPGASTNASVTIMLEDTLWWGGQLSIFHTEPAMQGSGGSVLIENPSGSTNTSTTAQTTGQSRAYVPYALLAFGAILVVSAAYVFSTSRQGGVENRRGVASCYGGPRRRIFARVLASIM